MNKKILIFLIVSTYITNTCNAQIDRYPKFIVGMETGGTVSLPADGNSNFPKYWAIRSVPHFDFKIHRRFYAGVQFEYAFGKVEDTKLIPQKGVGITAKYYYKNNSRNRIIKDRLSPYSELSWNLLDYTINYNKEYGHEPLGTLKNQNIQLITGINLRLFKYLYFDYGIRTMYYSYNKKFLLTPRVGLQYHIGEQRTFTSREIDPEVEKRKNQKLKPFDFRYFLKNATAITRYSLVFSNFDTGDLFQYKQNTLSFAPAVSISSDITFGLMYHPIWVKIRNEPSKSYYMFGPFVQYDFIRDPDLMKLFVEIGYYKGNLCTCGDGIPFEEKNLSILPVGFGLEKKMKKTPISISLSLHTYQILNASRESWTFGHPTIGVNYNLYKN